MTAQANWVLLRGLMRDARHWGPFPAALAQALPGARIHTPDFAGNGYFHALRSPAEVGAMLEFCRAQLRAQAIAPPYHLFALSLGAMVALQWCTDYPHEVAGAVLVNTSLRPHNPFYRRLRWQNYPAIARAALGGAARREALVLRLTSRDAQARADLLGQWTGFARQWPVGRANALRQLYAAARFRAPAHAPAVPLLVLVGAGDRLVDPACSRTLAARWQLALCEHPSAGHDLPLDEPEWVARVVAEWVGQTGV